MTAIHPSLLLQFKSSYFKLKSYEISHFKDREKIFALQNLRGYLSVFLFDWLSKSDKSLTFRGCEVHIKITGVNVGVQIGICLKGASL